MRGPKGGFTFVEIVIAVLILAILAMMVVPRLAGGAENARKAALEKDLRMLREQIRVYKLDHDGRSPHLDENGARDTANFIARMTGRTDPDGALNPAGQRGPYMPVWPSNPYVDPPADRQITFGKSATPDCDDSTGWYFSTRSEEIFPNSSQGVDDGDDSGL